jgi:hypothetical protein
MAQVGSRRSVTTESYVQSQTSPYEGGHSSTGTGFLCPYHTMCVPCSSVQLRTGHYIITAVDRVVK